MDIAYKLTDQNLQTHGGLQWAVGCDHYVTRPSKKLCTRGVLHGYRDPLLAVFMAPIHVSYSSPRMLRVECEIVVDDGTKIGSWWMHAIEELSLPNPTTAQRVAFGILCAVEVSVNIRFIAWADDWLSGKDRSKAAARAAAAYAYARADAYASASAGGAAVAAYSAYSAAASDIARGDLVRIANQAMNY